MLPDAQICTREVCTVGTFIGGFPATKPMKSDQFYHEKSGNGRDIDIGWGLDVPIFWRKWVKKGPFCMGFWVFFSFFFKLRFEGLKIMVELWNFNKITILVQGFQKYRNFWPRTKIDPAGASQSWKTRLELAKTPILTWFFGSKSRCSAAIDLKIGYEVDFCLPVR